MFGRLFALTLLSGILTFLLTPFTILLAKKFNLVDNPKVRPHPAHTHQGTIPRAGGLPIFLGIFLPAFFLFPLNRQFWGIFLGAFLLLLIGLWDDKKDLSPYFRFFTNCLAAFLAVKVGITIPYITHPLGGILSLENLRINFSVLGQNIFFSYSDLFAFLWIIWTTNIIGWSGGVDGQLPGFVAISALIIGLLSLRFAQTDISQLTITFFAFLTSGAFLGFLPWNFYPQKIMPGYGGKTLGGFFLALLSILSFSKLGTAILVLAIPMTDAGFMLVRRIISGRSPVWASKGHLHHHLLDLGWGKRKIAFFYWTISGLAGLAALFLNSRQKVFAVILVLTVALGFILWINYFRKLPKFSSEE